MNNRNDLSLIGHESLKRLPGLLYVKIKELLNQPYLTEPAWLKVAVLLDGAFEMSTRDVALIQNKKDSGDSFLQYLWNKGMTIGQFVEYASHAGLLVVADLFTNVHVPILIQRQPFPEMNVFEGESLEMTVSAYGFPPPCFQWYKDLELIPNATFSTLQYDHVSSEHSGTYLCLVWNDAPIASAVRSNEVKVHVSQARPMVIRQHPPSSITVKAGGNAWMKCDVWGEGQICYQWMKDGQELTDGRQIQGAYTNELHLQNIDGPGWRGYYSCQITRNNEVVHTSEAVLRVTEAKDSKKFTATDKVALLMGVCHYTNELNLDAPENDIKTLAGIFLSLGFKVMSYCDLSKADMLMALNHFKQLLGEGVYCVIYLCGHGFEAANLSFLVPSDAPSGYEHTDCLAAEDILFNHILPMKPKVCCMILDVCREIRIGPTVPQLVLQRPELPNHITIYSTAQGLNAYEKGKHGILVNHLKNILLKDLCIERTFQKLREDLFNDPLIPADGKPKVQIPEVRSILSETERSFGDPIDCTGYTTAYIRRAELWERAQVKPEDREASVNFEDFSVTLKMSFQRVMSTVWKMFVAVVDQGRAAICKVMFIQVPVAVAERAKIEEIQPGSRTNLCLCALTLRNIHHLKTDLIVDIEVTCDMEYGQRLRKIHSENMGIPLISKLWVQSNGTRIPREQEEE